MVIYYNPAARLLISPYLWGLKLQSPHGIQMMISYRPTRETLVLRLLQRSSDLWTKFQVNSSTESHDCWDWVTWLMLLVRSVDGIQIAALTTLQHLQFAWIYLCFVKTDFEQYEYLCCALLNITPHLHGLEVVYNALKLNVDDALIWKQVHP